MVLSRGTVECRCCGYVTLTSRGEDEICLVCGWADGPGPDWAIDQQGETTLVEAQHAFLADARPFEDRDEVRAPRPWEARRPDWQPIEQTPELLGLVAESYAQWERDLAEMDRRAERERARVDERLTVVNREVAEVRALVPALDHDEVVRRLTVIYRRHRWGLGPGLVEMMARRMRDENYYRDHPAHIADWLERFSTPGRRERDAEMLRTGEVRFAG